MLGLVDSKIQKGRSTGSATITIEAVSDIKKCVLLSSRAVEIALTSTTTLVVGGATDWEVIELGGAVV